ncbi:MAG: GGDEF domain-containing protein [Polymorphobacter sp.]
MTKATKVAMSSGISLLITMMVMAVVSRIPGLEVPLAWWIIGALLPVVISAPITWLMARQSERIAQLNDALLVAYAELKQLANTDSLTGAWNRAAFDARVAAARLAGPGWFLIVDVDNFKGINDAFGHAAGDAVLRHIGARLQSAAGPAALVGRIGGEEFAVWLPVGDEVSALRLAEDLRRVIAAKTIAVPDHPALSATVSIGATCGRGLDIDAALHRADRAMYRAKHDGRNLVRLTA